MIRRLQSPHDVVGRRQALEDSGMKEPDWEPELRQKLAEADVTAAVDEGVNMVLLAAAQAHACWLSFHKPLLFNSVSGHNQSTT